MADSSTFLDDTVTIYDFIACGYHNIFHKKMRVRKVQKEYRERISRACKIFGHGPHDEMNPMMMSFIMMMRFYYDEPKWITADEAYVPLEEGEIKENEKESGI